MSRTIGTIITGLSVSALGVLSWLAITQENTAIETQIRFDRASEFTFTEVRRCLKSGTRSNIFSQFRYAGAARVVPNPGRSLFMDQDGSTLFVYTLEDKTVVRFKSARIVSPEQLDLLEWCVKNPQLTWIRPEIR
ncbi:hypothetical protein [Parasphingorhabdus sp.]|uniref:hypothetical protein n=1 Tax=Parasphingorhabdus sp. TaxID=2709688 RepID=UPI003D2DF9B2